MMNLLQVVAVVVAVATCVNTVSAFGIVSTSNINVRQQQQPTSLFANTENSKAVTAAEEASAKFGPTSPEARVAWDVVEELNSADNSAALGGSLDDECELDDNMNAVSVACQEYGSKLSELQVLLESTSKSVSQVKNLAAEMKEIKLSFAGKPSKPAPQTPAMKESYEKAIQIQQQYGTGSIESRLAWLEVEEIASSGYTLNEPYIDSENCALEEASIDACVALEEVNRYLLTKTTAE